jgi:hypothetical protein
MVLVVIAFPLSIRNLKIKLQTSNISQYSLEWLKWAQVKEKSNLGLKKILIKSYVHFSVCVKYEGVVRDKCDEKELGEFFIGRRIVNRLKQVTRS